MRIITAFSTSSSEKKDRRMLQIKGEGDYIRSKDYSFKIIKNCLPLFLTRNKNKKVDHNIKKCQKFSHIFPLILNVSNRKGFDHFIMFKSQTFFIHIK